MANNTLIKELPRRKTTPPPTVAGQAPVYKQEANPTLINTDDVT